MAGPGSLPCGAGLDQGYTVLVVEDVQRLALQGDRGVGPVLAVDLEGAEVDPLGFPRRGAPAGEFAVGHLADALPGRVIDVVRGLGHPAALDCLTGGRVQPVDSDPSAVPGSPASPWCCPARRRRTAAGPVTAQGRAGAGEPVAVPPRVPSRLGSSTAVVTGPAAIGVIRGAVRHPQKVANLVVAVPLGVAGHRGAVARLGQARPRRIGRAGRDRMRRSAPRLPEVLTPGRLDQPVERVVGVGGGRVDHLVAEENPLLGGVADQCGVADRVVGVAQVLQGLSPRRVVRVTSRNVSGS